MPQIEIMSSDLPHTLYKRHDARKNVKRGNPTPTQADVDEATRLFEEAQRRKAEREGKGEYTVEELFNGAADED